MSLQSAPTRSSKMHRYAIVILTFGLYVGTFTYFHDDYGLQLTALAIFPIVVGSWYFGISGGILITFISILADIGSLLAFDHSLGTLLTGAGYITGNIILLSTAVIVGRMATLLHERGETLRKLKELEDERRNHIELLETLNEITKVVLEAHNLNSALTILVERIGKLFKADDCFFAFWEEDDQVTTPTIAYGSMRETYPKLTFEPGERTLSAIVMEAEHPLIIEDLKSSPLINSRIASIFPSYSILGIPLIIQGKKIASFTLGYDKKREFDPQEIDRAKNMAQQIALVLTKLQLFENTQLQVKQLTVLHEVATITTEAETIDQLIERTTKVIGKNLFSDNFGILLMDDKKGTLSPHRSYRFTSAVQTIPNEVRLGRGVSGQGRPDWNPNHPGEHKRCGQLP